MVGDVKQSIYRFRQARPELFLSKYMTYHHEHGFDDRVIQLYKNFRSRPEVINCVNYIFRQIMSSDVGELDYTENEYLNPGAEFPQPQESCTVGGAVELHVLDLTSDKYEITPDSFAQNQPDQSISITSDQNSSIISDQNSSIKNSDSEDADAPEEESLDNIQHEARLVGNKIRSLITHRTDGFNVFDKKLGRCRPAQYRDIVILMRRQGTGPMFLRTNWLQWAYLHTRMRTGVFPDC
jgi:ATP-dependent helicase/nuclease subunit A